MGRPIRAKKGATKAAKGTKPARKTKGRVTRTRSEPRAEPRAEPTRTAGRPVRRVESPGAGLTRLWLRLVAQLRAAGDDVEAVQLLEVEHRLRVIQMVERGIRLGVRQHVGLTLSDRLTGRDAQVRKALESEWIQRAAREIVYSPTSRRKGTRATPAAVSVAS